MTDVPKLKTERLVLRGPETSDFESYAAFYASDATEYISGPLDVAAAWLLFASDAGHWALKGFGWWTVTENDVTVGCVGFHHPPHQSDIEIGWNIYEGARGRGIAREAAEAALRWAVQTWTAPTWATDASDERRIVSYISDGNTASIALAERLGAVRLSERAAHDPTKAIYLHDLTRYAA